MDATLSSVRTLIMRVERFGQFETLKFDQASDWVERAHFTSIGPLIPCACAAFVDVYAGAFRFDA
jgi:hypothetical protein